GYAVIFDELGRLIAHPDEQRIGDDVTNENYYQQMDHESESGLIEFDHDGWDTVMGYAKNPTTGWIVGGIVRKDDFSEQARSIITPILITLTIVLLLAISISLLTVRRITRAIRMVMERMK